MGGLRHPDAWPQPETAGALRVLVVDDNDANLSDHATILLAEIRLARSHPVLANCGEGACRAAPRRSRST